MKPIYQAAGLLLAILSGCNKPAPAEDPQIAVLKAQVADMQTQLQEARVAAAPKSPTYTLVVSWPSKGGNDYRQGYDDQTKCEAAREVILQDNARLRAEAKAKVGTEVSPGVRIVAAGEPVLPTALCLPS